MNRASRIYTYNSDERRIHRHTHTKGFMRHIVDIYAESWIIIMKFFRVRHRFFFFFGMVARCQIIFRTTGMRLKSFLGCSYFECCTVYGLLLFCAMYSGRYVSSHPQKFQKKKKIHLKGPIWLGDVELSASIVKKFIRLFFFFLFSCHY